MTSEENNIEIFVLLTYFSISWQSKASKRCFSSDDSQTDGHRQIRSCCRSQNIMSVTSDNMHTLYTWLSHIWCSILIPMTVHPHGGFPPWIISRSWDLVTNCMFQVEWFECACFAPYVGTTAVVVVVSVHQQQKALLSRQLSRSAGVPSPPWRLPPISNISERRRGGRELPFSRTVEMAHH